MAELIPFDELRGGERADVAARADFAVLPVGAVEWHGPHLPFGTDVILAREFARCLTGDFTAVLFPPMPYSACPGKTSGHQGTIAIRPEVALAYLCDILKGIVDAGFERVLVLNGHDANMSMARAAMEWVSGRRRASFLLVNWFQLLTPAEPAHWRTERTMASISRRPSGSWQARYRAVPGGPQKSKTFERKVGYLAAGGDPGVVDPPRTTAQLRGGLELSHRAATRWS